jgi:hypothetical protein
MIQEAEIPAEVRTAFAAGPGDEPELTPTAEQLVATGRRQLRRRRALGTGAAAVAVAGVLATVSGVLPGPPVGGVAPAAADRTGTVAPTRTPGVTVTPTGPPATAVPPTGAPSSAIAPTGTPPTASPSRAETEAARLHRLTAALQAVVHPPAGGRLETAESFRPGLDTLEFVASQGGYKAAADERDPLGRGSLFVEVDPGSYPNLADPCPGTPSCTSYHTATGDLVAVSTETDADQVTYVVNIQRTDGTQVTLLSSNYAQDSVPQRKNAPPVGAQRPTPPWTAEQLVAIGLTPDLRS